MSPFFVGLIMFESLCAAVAYALAGDWRKALYWASATGIAISLLF